jgi:ankyrin repeat protein
MEHLRSGTKTHRKKALSLEKEVNDTYSAHVFELITTRNLVSKVPEYLFNDENIVFKDESGEVLNGLIHICSTTDQWKDLPSRLITEKNLLVQNFLGNTPLHEAASYGSYDFIRENLDTLSERILVSVNKDNDSALELILSTKIGKNTDRPPLKDKETILPRLLKNFEPESLKDYYKNRLKDNPLIDPNDKTIFKRYLAIPAIKKLAQSEQYLEI